MFFLCVLAASFSLGAEAEGKISVARDDDPNRVKPGDVVDISVFEAPDLAASITVPECGWVMFPLIPKLQLADKTPEEIARDVREGLRKAGHLTSASVTVRISRLAHRVVYMMGAVKSAEKVEFPRNEPLTVSRAIAAVGGFKEEADRRRVKVFRRRGGLKVFSVDVEAVLERGQPALDLELQDGDLVFVTSLDFVYVFGNVNSPGAYRLPPGVPVTVSRCISMAGGFTKFARTNKVRLIRRRAARPEDRVAVLDLRLVIEHGQNEKDLPVSPGDIIFVPESLF